MSNNTVDNQWFTANGKLLLSGEYTILDGAYGIGLPVQLGQKMRVSKSQKATESCCWQSIDVNDNVWFECSISNDFNISNATDEAVGRTLESILLACKNLNKSFHLDNVIEIQTYLEFDRNWGLGSSSTLIYLLADWAKVDPFELLDATIGGSGYDIACAGRKEQLFITRKKGKVLYEPVSFYPNFHNQLYFVFLEQKQKTSDALQSYSKLSFDRKAVADSITSISKKMLISKDLVEFQELLTQHETILSDVLKTATIQSKLFSDFNGVIKSLGAWGGDFVLAASHGDKAETQDYFNNRGYSTILSFNELVFSS